MATLTGKPIEYFPLMSAEVNSSAESLEEYKTRVDQSLNALGYQLVQLDLGYDSRRNLAKAFPNFPYIMIGTSPRGWWKHSVIYQDGQMIHDPHPTGEGLINNISIQFLVPLVPWLPKQN